MKRTKYLFVLATAFCFAACSGEKKNQTNEDGATAADLSSAPALTAPATPAPGQPQPETPGAAPAASTAGLNPPHGQPGHDCSIAVGAPLNGTIGSQPNQNVRLPSVIPAQPTGPVAAGTNPPHGQPGHDCSVAVGAPLPAK